MAPRAPYPSTTTTPVVSAAAGRSVAPSLNPCPTSVLPRTLMSRDGSLTPPEPIARTWYTYTRSGPTVSSV